MTTRPAPRQRLLIALTAALLALLALTVPVHAESGSTDGPHLPTAVNAPGAWAEVEDVRGPVAALGETTRTEPVGLFDSREALCLFAVSAVDGRASWISLPGLSLDHSGIPGGVALSPDGLWIGWARPPAGRPARPGRIGGWSVMSTLSGEVRRLDVPGVRSVKSTFSDLAFSGDSRYLLTTYALPKQSHRFVAWDVASGSPSVLEKPGQRWLPDLGSAPRGVVWSRGSEVFRADPTGGAPEVTTLPERVVTASWGPDDRSFAYIGSTAQGKRQKSTLYAGTSVAAASEHPIDLPSGIEPSQLLGWRDAAHVVVGHYRSDVHVVDVRTGAVERLDLTGSGHQVNAPLLAGALWDRPLGEPVDPSGTSDPREVWRWVGAGLLLTLGLVGAVLWRRRPQRSEPESPPPSWPLLTDLPEGQFLRPLASAASGLLLVVLDVRLDGLDLIPDPIGWAVVGLMLGRLVETHRAFHLASTAAWIAVVPSIPEWLGAGHWLITTLVAVALLTVQVATCTGLAAVDPPRRRAARWIRSLTLGLTAALLLAVLAASAESSAAALVLAVGLADLGVLVWFLVLLCLASQDEPALARPVLVPEPV